MARGAKTSKGAASTVLSIGVAARPVPPHYEGWNVLVGGDQPAAKPDVALSLRNLKAQPGGEYDAVYCAYALQTCYAHEVGGVVEGLRHLVKPGGFVEIRVPDVGAIMRVAVERRLDLEDELYKSQAGSVSVRDALYGFAQRVSASPEHFAHRVALSRNALRAILSRAGFAAASLLRPRALEIAIVAFPQPPSDEHKALLKLK